MDATKPEMNKLDKYKVFTNYGTRNPPPSRYNKTRVHSIFDIDNLSQKAK